MIHKIKEYKYLILGAGPSGLSFARTLLDYGEKSFLILEQEKKAGGLCRSKIVDGTPLDIGGGHFLDVTRKNVLKFLFRFLPKKEWNLFKRCSKISIHGQFIDYPIESHIWHLPIDLQISYLKSIFQVSNALNKKNMPVKFHKWVYKKFGDKIAENYMIPYNKKLWGNHYKKLSTTWFDKIPDVSFEEIIESCLNKSSKGRIPAHKEFYYPKKDGYGKVWLNMAKTLDSHILYKKEIKSLDFKNLIVNKKFKAKYVINTIPWISLDRASNFPAYIHNMINKLKKVSLRIDYFSKNSDSPAHWTYVPDEKVSYHRILHRHNFIRGSRGHWTETNSVRTNDGVSKIFSTINDFSYPVNVVGKDNLISSILKWAKKNNIYGIGRWGKWQHINSDVTVEEAIDFAKKMLNL